MEQVLTERVLAEAKKIAARKEREFVEMVERIQGLHPHAITDSLAFDEGAKKWKCRITCVVTGNTERWVFTSDLHQVDVCLAVAEERKSAKREGKKLEKKAAMDLYRQQQAAKAAPVEIKESEAAA